MNPRLLAMAVHDIKNALGTLDDELATLAERPQPELARQAREHCADLRHRLVAFLTMYRSDVAIEPNIADESPIDFLHYLARHVPRPSGAPLRVCDDADADAPPYWHFDRHLVRLALEAALHNAWRHTSGDVVLRVRKDDGYLVLVVDDDGPGPGNGTPSEWSTGLGTGLCEAIASAHRAGERRGRIALFDRAIGDVITGARFELWLP